LEKMHPDIGEGEDTDIGICLFDLFLDHTTKNVGLYSGITIFHTFGFNVVYLSRHMGQN